MGLIVQKFGGTSVGSIERIQNVADRVIETYKQGKDVVVVVSAMGISTDHLIQMANDISENPSKRELDMLVSTGEQVSMSLLAMALQEKGYQSISLTGWQAGIKTENAYGNARILDIDIKRVNGHLANGNIVIVAGFQGLTDDDEIATLGRGGSDTTAVALAASLKAEKCEIYTDVTGVYTTDPRVVKEARKLDSISYDEMLEMANLGAGVLHPRSVEFAKNYNVKLEVRSSMEKETGTMIEEDVSMEGNLTVRGIAFEDNVTKVTVHGLQDDISTLSTLFTILSDHKINVDIIIQNTNGNEATDISFSLDSQVLKYALEVLSKYQTELNYEHISYEGDLSKVSIVGSGMISNPGVAAKMFNILASKQIKVKMVSTSEIKVSTIVDNSTMLSAIECLHEAFELEAKQPVNV
ncbi:aspartate kinase [Pseudalkalibacillus salsuginis]|uniref:aspartate kinase n=1 Tax=Pseudalkalibacillus salsuginis TaxID=2910972 RepID=UPI001F2AC5F0|nr:aspartate kinase [Pseudalkalibacillus salsuginis]MCF6408155.1 aspartate kinase [Pseudalkalibacillus salsuginis]